MEVANTLNNYFSNVVKNLKTPEKFVTDSLPQSLSRHPTLNAILKYKNHPSMRVIKRFSQRFSSFYFSHVDKNTVLKEIKKLNFSKAAQDSDISVTMLQENADFFADYIYLQFNEAADSSKFADFFKSKTFQQHLSKVPGIKRRTKGQSVFCLSFQKFLKILFAGNSQISLMIFYQNFNADLEKATAHNIVSF